MISGVAGICASGVSDAAYWALGIWSSSALDDVHAFAHVTFQSPGRATCLWRKFRLAANACSLSPSLASSGSLVRFKVAASSLCTTTSAYLRIHPFICCSDDQHAARINVWALQWDKKRPTQCVQSMACSLTDCILHFHLHY